WGTFHFSLPRQTKDRARFFDRQKILTGLFEKSCLRARWRIAETPSTKEAHGLPRGLKQQDKSHRNWRRANPRIETSAPRGSSGGIRGRTGSSPAHPFGNLATTGTTAEGPWLCVPGFRSGLPFRG